MFLGVQGLIGEEQAPEEAAWPMLGESFLGFSIIGELGSGAFARVYLASEDALGDRHVALKVALRGNAEANILGRLDHPNIVPVYSVQHDSDTGLSAVCMPFLGRATLVDVLDWAFSVDGASEDRSAVDWPTIELQAVFDCFQTPGGRAENRSSANIWEQGVYIDAVVRLAIQLADALAHGHARGISHRDIKPSNVLLTFEGNALLLDYNLSIDDRSCLDRIGGTLPYMAPGDLEVLADPELPQPLHADPRSDVYSLGVILYQLLCGEVPYEPNRWDRSIAEVVQGLLDRQRLGLGEDVFRGRNAGVSRRLEEIVVRCLEIDPEKRFQAAAELAKQLRRYFNPLRRMKRWVRRHPWRVATVASLATVVLVAWCTYLALRPPYAVRQLNEGLAYYEQAEYPRALDCLNEAVRYDPSSTDALVARGKTYLRLEKYDSAFESFNTARGLSEEPLLSAAAGYSRAKLGHHEEALFYYAEAFDAGDRSASLLNNIGYSYLRLRRLDEAERYFRMALEVDSSLGVARHNLLTVHLRRVAAGSQVSSDSLKIAAQAVRTAAPSAETYRDAAYLYCLAAQDDSSLVDDALLWLERALECGLDREGIVEDVGFSILHGTPEFKRLLKTPMSTTQLVPPQRLVEPL